MRSPLRRTLAVALFTGLTIGASALAATAGDTPGPGTSSSGRVTHFHFEYGPIDIRPGQNVIETNRTLIPQPKINGWIVGFEPNLRMPNGTVPPVDQIHLHHGVWATGNHFDKTSFPLPERFLGVGEEKTQLHFPPGYGYEYRVGDYWWLNYMIHNLTSRPYKVSITYDVDMIAADDAPPGGLKSVHPRWMDVQNGSIYPVFDVIKGSGTGGTFTYPDQAGDPYSGGKVKNQWVVDRPGVLVHTFGHLHPGGLRVDFNLSRGDRTAHLFSSTAKYYEPAGAVSWDVSMTATRPDWAVTVQPGDVLKVSATYDTTRASWYESMGLGVVWMYDGPGGKDPFTTKVDTKGVLTHGHLPENDNHGGKKTTLARPQHSGRRRAHRGRRHRRLPLRRQRPHRPQAGAHRRAGAVDHVRQLRREREIGVALDHVVQGAVHRDDRRRLPARRRAGRVRLGAARRGGGADGGPGDVADARRPARGHLHVLLPDPPLHARSVPRH